VLLEVLDLLGRGIEFLLLCQLLLRQLLVERAYLLQGPLQLLLALHHTEGEG
jgi:hypothetical protein